MMKSTQTASAPPPKKTVADIWAEVQTEQRQFNRVIRYLILALMGTAFVAGIAAILSLTEFRNLRQNYKDQIEYAIAESAVQRSQAERERQAMRIELLRLENENSQNRVFARLARQTDQALATAGSTSFSSVRELQDDALQFALLSATGRLPMNSATGYLVEGLVEFDRVNEDALFLPDENRLLQAALQDWQQPDADSTRRAWTLLATTAESARLRGVGSAGLAHFEHRLAADNSPRLGWANGCADVVRLVAQAKQLEVTGIGLELISGACLRKNGNYEDAYLAFINGFQAIASEASGNQPNSYFKLEESRLQFELAASHGAGTTLIPFAIRLQQEDAEYNEQNKLEEIFGIFEQLPDDRSEFRDRVLGANSILEVAEILLNQAVDIRRKRNEGEVGEFGSKENLGFLYIARKDWDKALELSREIDARMTRHWNLIVYAIALKKRNLSNTDEYARVLKKIELISVDGFDVSEISKMLPPEQITQLRQILSVKNDDS